MSNRKQMYIDAFNKADMAKKIRSIKAMEAYGKLDRGCRGISRVVDSMAECLDSIYPEKWDILLQRREVKTRDERDRYVYTTPAENPFTVEFIIHFPIINMVNSQDEKHTIKDLYVKLVNKSNGSNFTFKKFTGRRMSASKEEIYSKYQHSHLPSRAYRAPGRDDSRDYGAFYWRNFCLGESEIRQVLTMLESTYSEGNFKLLLLQLEEYVNWESIEGTPHIHMRSVMGNTKSKMLTTDMVVSYADSLKNRLPSKEIDFALAGNQVRVIQNEKFEEYLRLYSNHNSYNADIIARKGPTGKYYRYRFLNSNISSDHLSSPEELEVFGFMFGQERVDFKVLDANQEIDKTFYLHKQIKEYVTEQIEKGIKDTRFRNHITKSLSAIENISEDTRQNRLFVPSN